MQAMSLAQGQKQLFELHERVVHEFEPVILTHDEGSMVLVSLDEWNSWTETARLLRDREAMEALLTYLTNRGEQVQSGKSLEDIFADLV